MPDKFPPKNSEFRFESFRFSSDVTDCRHAIYHHGCPSCDERDPEGNEVCAVCGEIYCPGCELAAAEKVMDPILRRWFAYDCAPHEVGHYAENAAVDLSWALQNAGLLVPHNDALMSEPITPMDGEALANMRHTHRERPSDTAVGYCDECGGHWPCDVATLLARLDVAEADLRSEIEDANELVELFRMALAERDAALASSPEGVVTLPKLGQRVRITTGGGMDHVGEVIRYGDPEGNVRTLFMVALDDGSSGYFLDEPSWHWTEEER